MPLFKTNPLRSSWQTVGYWGTIVLAVALAGSDGRLPKPALAREVQPAKNLLAVAPPEPIAEAILGQWHASALAMTLVFAPEGKLFLLLDGEAGVKLAEEIRYRLNPDTQPMQIDLTLNQDETITTIFELTPERQLRLELTHVAPGDERPTAFTDQVLVFEQTSRSTSPPQAGLIHAFDQRQNQAREREAQLYMGALAQAQEAFFQRYDKFAATLDEFVAGIEPETDFYRYMVVPNANPALGVTLMAQAKAPGLRSFTSLVFALPGQDTAQVGTTLCQSTRPSTIPPTLLVQMPVQDPQQVRCPSGAQTVK